MAAHTGSRLVGNLSSHQLLSIVIGINVVGRQFPAASSAFRGDINETFGGKGHVSGTVKIGSTPVARRVRLFEAKTGVLIREQWSGNDGTYSFTRLRLDLLYTVSSHDFDGGYNDVIAANVMAVL
jgi:hypothetical protein